MEPKKNPKFDLERNRGLYFQIGIAISLIVVLGAFEYRSYEKVLASLGVFSLEAVWEEDIENTFRKEPTPPPPPAPPIIDIVKDDEEITKELKIESTETGEDDPIDEVEESVSDIPFITVEQMPLFENCTDATCTGQEIQRHIQRNTKYPPIAKENNITGKVYLSFVVGKNGKVKDVQVLKGVDRYLDAEAVRVIKSMPDFTPGKQRGQAVNVKYNTRIVFSLQ